MRTLMLAIIGIIPAVAGAVENSNYVGGAYVTGEYEAKGLGDVDTTGVQLQFGRDLTRFFAIEGRAGTGFGNVTRFGSIDVETRVNYWASGFGKLFIDVSGVRPYALAGYTTGKATASTPRLRLEDTDQDFSYGVGLELFAGEEGSVFVEWVRYMDTDIYRIEAWSFGVNARF